MLRTLCLTLVLAATLAGIASKDAPAEEATYYGSESGGITASGEVFDPTDYTIAHPYLPFGTILTVCYVDCATGRVNDRTGPGTNLDLSRALADHIGLTPVGRDEVTVY